MQEKTEPMGAGRSRHTSSSDDGKDGTSALLEEADGKDLAGDDGVIERVQREERDAHARQLVLRRGPLPSSGPWSAKRCLSASET